MVESNHHPVDPNKEVEEKTMVESNHHPVDPNKEVEEKTMVESNHHPVDPNIRESLINRCLGVAKRNGLRWSENVPSRAQLDVVKELSLT